MIQLGKSSIQNGEKSDVWQHFGFPAIWQGNSKTYYEWNQNGFLKAKHFSHLSPKMEPDAYESLSLIVKLILAFMRSNDNKHRPQQSSFYPAHFTLLQRGVPWYKESFHSYTVPCRSRYLLGSVYPLCTQTEGIHLSLAASRWYHSPE